MQRQKRKKKQKKLINDGRNFKTDLFMRPLLNITRLLKFITVSLLFTAIFMSCEGISSKKDEDGISEASIVETGTLEAINTKSFILPRFSRYWYEMRITGILEHGTIVNEGDSIIQLDPTEVNKLIMDRETDLENQMAVVTKLIVNQSNKNNDFVSSIKSQEASVSLKKIELESSRFESQRMREIKELELKQSEITLAKEKRRLELAKIVDAANLKIQEVRIQRIKNEIESFQTIIPQLTIRTPVAGVFQVGRNMRTRELLNVGDIASPSYSMAYVPELKFMKVETFINENDFLKIRVGQKVAVRLDAMPETIFDGEISYIGKLCRPRERNSRQKGFDVEVLMTKPDERLKPGMTVSCGFITNR